MTRGARRMKAWRERRARAALDVLAGDAWRVVPVVEARNRPVAAGDAIRAVGVAAAGTGLLRVTLNGRVLVEAPIEPRAWSPRANAPIMFQLAVPHLLQGGDQIEARATCDARVVVELA